MGCQKWLCLCAPIFLTYFWQSCVVWWGKSANSNDYLGLLATYSLTNSTSNSIFWSFSSTNLTTYGRPSSIFCWISESDKFLQWPLYLFGTRFLADSFRNNASLFSVQKQGYANPPLKVKKILEGSLDSIPSPSPSVKIQIMGGKVCSRWKGKTLLGWKQKVCWHPPASNVLPYYLK